MLSTGNSRGGPFKDGLNSIPKFVASKSPKTQLPWINSTLLHGDIPAAIAALKQQPAGNLVIMDSGVLIRSLIPHALIDEFLLSIHPLIPSSGQRLFDHDNHLIPLKLVDATSTPSGVLLATYQPP